MSSDTTFYIIGLSGGPDSVALLHWMCQRVDKSYLLATHCNFHLRGDESMRDQAFCQQLCSNLQVPLLVQDFDTRTFMAEQKMSLELAARELRYNWWRTLAADKGRELGMPVRIAVGHHRDDSIETLLMNLMRGTGIKGLVGIPASNDLIIRPLLHMSRADILQYLSEHELSYITDSSNLENDATRNKIRNMLLPLMEQINPNVRQGIEKTIHYLQQTQRWESERLDEIFASTQQYQAAGATWYEWTVPASLLENSTHSGSDTLSDNDTIQTLFYHWSQRYTGATQHDQLFYTVLPDLSQQRAPLCTQILSLPSPSFSDQYQLFDLGKIQLPLTCRHWQEGDRIQPLGMKGASKLVSDLFTNAHYTPNRKATTWIVADASGRILWVVGLRVSDWAKITPDTRQILRVNKPE